VDCFEVQRHTAIRLQLPAGRQSSGRNVVEFRMDLVETQRYAAIRLQLPAGRQSSGRNVVEFRINLVGVQCLATIRLQLLAGGNELTNPFFFPASSSLTCMT
jgi:hypothetical protein